MDDYACLTIDEPMSYKQAMECDEKFEWEGGINEELKSLEKNETWSVVKKNSVGDVNIIDSRWVLKKKRDVNGKVFKYKARLVAKGFKQQEGIDYNETFAPVLKYTSLKILLALSPNNNIKLKQLDVKTAFLNAKVSENIYMKVPEGLNVDGSKYVLKLNRALYGLKQAPREWNKEVSSFLVNVLHYKQCKKDTCLYVKKSKTYNILIVGLFVDDMITRLYDVDENEWNIDLTMLKSKYELSDLGDVKHILGMKIVKSNNKIVIDQSVYINDKLKLFGYENAKIMSTPAVIMKNEKYYDENDNTENNNNIKFDDNNNMNDSSVNIYRAMCGSLLYACVSTRPDITYAVNMVSRYMSKPTNDSMNMMKRIFRYLCGTPDLGLIYESNNDSDMNDSVSVSGYCDADWGGDKNEKTLPPVPTGNWPAAGPR